MNSHTARILVKDSIFDLAGTIIPPHQWGWTHLSQVGISSEFIIELSRRLGINPATVTPRLTLEELTHKVAVESPLNLKNVNTR